MTLLTPSQIAEAQLAVTPPPQGAGELDSPARALLPRIPPGDVAGLAAAAPICYGVDLFEGNIWFEDATVTFINLKALELGYGQDSKFASRFALAKQTGRHRGAYVFGHPSYAAATTASAFCKILKDNGFTLADRAWLDHEVTDGKSPSYCAGWAADVCGLIDQEMGGAVTGVYTYTNFIKAGNCDGLGGYPLWFAYPEVAGGPVPGAGLGPWAGKAPELIQYAVTVIDWDFFPGDAAALAKFWGSAVPVPPPPIPAPQPEVSMDPLLCYVTPPDGSPPGASGPGIWLLAGGRFVHVPGGGTVDNVANLRAAGVRQVTIGYDLFEALTAP